MSGKGSTRRPQQISDEEMERRWLQAFGKKRKRDWWEEVEKERPDLFEENETSEGKKEWQSNT